MIEVIDLGAIFGSGGAVYYLIHKEIDKLKECISEKHLTNSKDITRIKERIGIE